MTSENAVVFQHIPKTGGNSLRKSLYEAIGGERLEVIGHNVSSIWTSQNKASVASSEGKFLIATVRNPYARFVSAWNYLYNGGMINEHDLAAMKILRRHGNNINAFVQSERISAYVIKLLHFIPMSNLMAPPQSYSYIAKMESLQTHMQEIGHLLGTTFSLSHENTEHKNRDKQTFKDLSSSSLEILANIYRKDFELFSYSAESIQELC